MNGGGNSLEELFLEATEEVVEKKKGIIISLIDKIKNAIQTFVDTIKEKITKMSGKINQNEEIEIQSDPDKIYAETKKLEKDLKKSAIKLKKGTISDSNIDSIKAKGDYKTKKKIKRKALSDKIIRNMDIISSLAIAISGLNLAIASLKKNDSIKKANATIRAANERIKVSK